MNLEWSANTAGGVSEEMPAAFVSRLAAAWPAGQWRSVGVVVAVSGGADSVALLRALQTMSQQLPVDLTVAHFNHGLRDAADDDARFVEDLASRLRLRCQVGQSSCDPREFRDGVEAAARQQRYDFLTETAQQLGARYVATAHTTNDQAETVLHRIIRGTGIMGLAGIPRVRELCHGVTLVRPLLWARRRDCERYLASLDQPFCTDESNEDRAFTRNAIRHDLMPQLETYNSQIVESLTRLASLAAEASDVLSAEARQCLANACVSQDKGAALDCSRLQAISPYLLRQLFIELWATQNWPQQHMSHEKWLQLADLAGVDPSPSRQQFPGDITVTRKGNLLRIEPPEAT